MKFIGQTKLIDELDIILEECLKGKNYNILLSAPSGFGKTTLALRFINGVGFYRSNLSSPPDFRIALNRRFQFLDEIHYLKDPEEYYRFLDSGEYTFILATNETGVLKEPLINRCIVLEFQEYTDAEASVIITNIMGRLPQDIIDVIIKVTSKIPRQIKVLCTRLLYTFNRYGVPTTSDGFLQLISNVLDINEQGYNPLQRRYIEYLDTIGGQASITTIANGLRIKKETLLREVEPRLMYDKKLIINSKGRTLINANRTTSTEI